jgi:hypothetical protein
MGDGRKGEDGRARILLSLRAWSSGQEGVIPGQLLSVEGWSVVGGLGARRGLSSVQGR